MYVAFEAESNRDVVMRENAVKIVKMLVKGGADLLVEANDGSTAGAVTAVDRFRDEIIALGENTLNERYRARLVRQGDLWDEGVELGKMMIRSKDSGIDEDNDEEQDTAEFAVQIGKYYGGKWGIPLRAPDLWFRLLDEFGGNLIPLGKIADVRFGVKTGKDRFFFPIDCSKKCLENTKDADNFRIRYGVLRKSVEIGQIKLVRCGDERGEIKPIESRVLEPEVHSLMEIDGFTVSPDDCNRMILLVDATMDELAGTWIARYIKWGEKQNWHKGATCAARVTEDSDWYDLTSFQIPRIILPKIQQYRLIAFLNPYNLYQNSSLLGIYDIADDFIMPLCGVLNSSIAILSRINYARILGNEGNIQLDVYSAKMMLVPNINRCKDTDIISRIVNAFTKMRERKALYFLSERRLRQMSFIKSGKKANLEKLSALSELDMTDRRELDDGVLEMLGVKSPQKRQEMIEELYSYLHEYFELTRQKEEKAISNKNKSKRRNAARPSEVAAQIYKDIAENNPNLLFKYEADFLDKSEPFETYDLPTEGTAETYSDMLVAQGVKFTKGSKTQLALKETKYSSQAELITLVANSGTRGLIRVPHDESECLRVLKNYGEFIHNRGERIKELIQERTSDEEKQEKVLAALMPLIINH